MKNTVSLKLNKDFKTIYKKGESKVSPVLVLYVRHNKTAGNRMGITVTSKVGCAVVRNRVRRRIREAYRLNESRFIKGIDIIAVARVRAAVCAYSEIENALLTLAGRLGILSEGQV